jgi:S-(hydroxymethyl)glutathione dehydrogenase/alcohol dehydrogenase
VDVALDATGNTQALLSAAQTIRRYGTISCVGLFARPAEFLAHEVIYRGIKLVMRLGNLVHVPKLTKLLEFGRVALTPVGTHVFSLDDAVVAYDLFENHKDQCLKAFLKP